MSRCRRSQRRSQSPDGQTDGEAIRLLRAQVEEAFRLVQKRLETLEMIAAAGTKQAPIVINVSGGSSLGISTETEDRMGFKQK